MKTYVAIIASIVLLATNAALGRDRAAVLTGVDQTAVYGTPANNGIQATWLAHYGMDQPPAMPSAAVVLTASRGGSMMQGRMHAQSGWSGRSNWGQGFHSRSFGNQSFNRGHSFHGDFRHDGFHHRDDFVHRGFRYYPYGHFYSYPYRYYPYHYYYPYSYYPYRYYYPYSYYYPYGSYYGSLGYVYPYPYSYFYFSW